MSGDEIPGGRPPHWPAFVMWVVVGVLLVLLTATAVGRDGHITEDDPRWNCETMGNQTCGRVSNALY